MFKEKDPTTTTERDDGKPGEAQPAARFMQTGGQMRPTASVPIYKLKQKLDDLDLQLRHPRLNRKWRRKIASPRAEQTPVLRGRPKKSREEE